MIDADIVAYCTKHGLDTFQRANTLLANEIEYGHLGSLGMGAWNELGMTDEQVMEFFDIAHASAIVTCPKCRANPGDPESLPKALAVIWGQIARDSVRTCSGDID